MSTIVYSVLIFVTFAALCCCENSGYIYQQPQTYSQYGNQDLNSYGQSVQLSYQPYQTQVVAEQQYASPKYEENYRKEFYSFSAPEEEFNDPLAAHKIYNSLQKNVRVVFIRAPEQRGIEEAALALAKQATDDRTAIFVLNRQPDIGDLASKLTVLREHNNHKPEVHFVKYRTPEEAAQAQHHIQAQYDILRGTSHSSNEGVAPVLNFASQAQHYVPALTSNYGQGYGGQTPSVLSAYGGIGSSSYAAAANLLAATGLGVSTGAVDPTTTSTGAVLAGPIFGVGRSSGSLDQQQSFTDSAVSKINERLSSSASKFVFPTESTVPSITYLPPLKRKRSQ